MAGERQQDFGDASLDGETKAYLARIRRTISESERLVEQAALRIAETDRLLESQGLSREQVMNFRFTEAQREAANEELKRRGFDPLEAWTAVGPHEDDAAVAAAPGFSSLAQESPDGELAERQRKFGMMMKPFQL